jgi:LacI family transcriptional regulator
MGSEPGRQLTSRDIASLAGVSQTTVSRVLSGGPHVSEATRSRVLAVLEETGYVPNTAARLMRAQASGVIGVVVGRVTSPFYPQILDHLATAIEARGRLMSVWISDAAEEGGTLEAIDHGAVDGFVFMTATPDSRSLRSALRRGSPTVLVNRPLAGIACDQVVADSPAGGVAIARHFLDGKRLRIAMIGGPHELSIIRERESGFVAELERSGRPLEERLSVCGELSHADGYRAMRELLEGGEAPDAVYCVNDVVAMGAIDATRDLGVDVPKDVWVAGFDDIEMSSWGAYSLTTVHQPMAEMADRAIEFVVERITGTAPAAPREVRLAAELIVRRSTGG